MIITLSGITGVGKSFFKEQIIRKLGFKNLTIITTREKRQDEIDGIDKYFVTKKEFYDMKQEGSIVADFEFLGYQYAYRREDILGHKNQVTEMHYEYIDKLKECSQDVLAIYIVPNSFERAKQELRKRKLEYKIENDRMQEMKQQKNIFEKHRYIQNKFDIIFENNYTQESISYLIRLIRERIEDAKQSNCRKLENEYVAK